MKTHVFTKTLVVAGVKHNAGDEVNQDEIPSGYFASCVRLGDLVEIPKSQKAEIPLLAYSESEVANVPGTKPMPVLVSPPPTPDEGDDPDATPAELAAKKQTNGKKK